MRGFFVKQHEDRCGNVVTTIEGYEISHDGRELIYHKESEDSGIIEDLFEYLPHNSVVYFDSGVYEAEKIELTSANIVITSIPALNKIESIPVIKTHRFILPKWSIVKYLELRCGEIICEKTLMNDCIIRETVINNALVVCCNIFGGKISGEPHEPDLVIERSNIFDSDLRHCNFIRNRPAGRFLRESLELIGDREAV
mgnify:CR=1 FL=1